MDEQLVDESRELFCPHAGVPRYWHQDHENDRLFQRALFQAPGVSSCSRTGRAATDAESALRGLSRPLSRDCPSGEDRGRGRSSGTPGLARAFSHPADASLTARPTRAKENAESVRFC